MFWKFVKFVFVIHMLDGVVTEKYDKALFYLGVIVAVGVFGG